MISLQNTLMIIALILELKSFPWLVALKTTNSDKYLEMLLLFTKVIVIIHKKMKDKLGSEFLNTLCVWR